MPAAMTAHDSMARRTSRPWWRTIWIHRHLTSVVGTRCRSVSDVQRLVRLAMLSCCRHGGRHRVPRTRSYPLAVALVLVYGVLIWLDSSSLTAGAAGSADPARRGATLALHSMAGYAGGFVGPIVIGWILDRAGGMSPVAWGSRSSTSR